MKQKKEQTASPPFLNQTFEKNGDRISYIHISVAVLKARQCWYMPLIPVGTLICHKGQVVVVHAFNPSIREEYKVGGDGPQAQSQSQSEDL